MAGSVSDSALGGDRRRGGGRGCEYGGYVPVQLVRVRFVYDTVQLVPIRLVVIEQ